MTISKRAFVRLLIITALIFATLGAMASEQGDAEKAVARGWAALEESNSDTAKSVDAALAFTEALNYYRTVGEMDTCQELQANIFWAKKRMNADDLTAYLAAKGHESAPALVKVMDEVVDQKIEVTEADKYFADAEAFAKKRPTEHLKIAIRYFEVASRFPGTAVSLEAQQRSLAAQGKAKVPGRAKTAKAEKTKTDDAAKTKKVDLAKADPAKVQAYYKHWVRGTWYVKCQGYAGAWTFDEKGSITRPGDGPGSYEITKDALVLHWSNGQEETMQFVLPDGDQNTAVGTNFAGLALTFTRKEPLKVEEFKCQPSR